MRKKLSRSVENVSIQEESVQQLIRRLLPNHHMQFVVEIIDAPERIDKFEVSSSEHQILISGTSGVAIAKGLNWYLKNYCNAHVSWDGDQLNLPAILPEVDEKITISAAFKYRYYLNYCTFSYSMPWWNWERWEREIDLMALNGINFPLAIVGHELVWENVFRDFGMTQEEILQAFAGPAFRSWGWMGNIECWGGPLPESWIKIQSDLQKKILKRQREFGMNPILQGFSGIVPEKFKKYFPDAIIHQLPGWYGFKGVYQLDPKDPLFKTTGRKFMQEQNKLYGTNHFYSADIYHELNYLSNDFTYLLDLAKGVYSNLVENDPAGIWVMQSWSLQEDILNVLPDDKIIVLDLFCDSNPKWKKNNSFNSKQWIWCALHNFGGRTGLSGRLNLLADEIPGLNNNNKGNLIGIGYAPEGIENNFIFYNLLYELAWEAEQVEFDEWVKKYITARYGEITESVLKAWYILQNTVYTGPESYGPMESEICARPSMNIKKVSSNGELNLYYKPELLIEALKLLLECKSNLNNSGIYRHDVVDVFRQVLVNLAKPIYLNIVDAYHRRDLNLFKKQSKKFLQLIQDIDLLLSTDEKFLVGKWIADAKKLGRNENERSLLEWNARRQITLWSTLEITEFHDYANKHWSGLMVDYYMERWRLFFNSVADALEINKGFEEANVIKEIDEFAVNWAFSKKEFPSIPAGDALNIIYKLFEKYQSVFKEIYPDILIVD